VTATVALEAALATLLSGTEACTASIARFEQGDAVCRIYATAGEPLLAPGTRFPVESSTNIMAARAGRSFVSRDLIAEPGFDRAIDRLILSAGLRASCTVPLALGVRRVGALSVMARERGWHDPAALERVEAAAAGIVLALATEGDAPPGPRVLVAHDDPLALEGLIRVAEQRLAADVLGCASLDHLAAQASRGADLVAIDAVFDRTPLEAVAGTVRSAGCAASIVVIASHDTAAHRRAALRAGVTGYVSRTVGVAAIGDALVRGAEGDGKVPAPHEAGPELAPLTRRETQVLVLLERGLQVKQAAATLGISEATARGHVRNLLAKLGAHSITRALHVARVTGLLATLPSELIGPDGPELAVVAARRAS